MWLPGDPPRREAEDVASMLRVDHAGEYGARQIYRGQLAVAARRPHSAAQREAIDAIREMQAQELAHLAAFEALLPARRVRPSLLMPLWHAGGWLLGAVTAALGPKAAMACTVAVESVIDEHYAAQEDALADSDEVELRTLIARFRAEEQEHHATGLAHGAEEAPLYRLLHAAIAALTRSSVALAQRF